MLSMFSFKVHICSGKLIFRASGRRGAVCATLSSLTSAAKSWKATKRPHHLDAQTQLKDLHMLLIYLKFRLSKKFWKSFRWKLRCLCSHAYLWIGKEQKGIHFTFAGDFKDNLASIELVHFNSIPMQESTFCENFTFVECHSDCFVYQSDHGHSDLS